MLFIPSHLAAVCARCIASVHGCGVIHDLLDC
jgi:hypothetical protein